MSIASAMACFNSTLVRLEVGIGVLVLDDDARFNSTLVRLEVDVLYRPKIQTRRFNSTLVRLEAIHGWLRCVIPAEFQFHTGSIRRQIGHPSRYIVICFNSTLVRLEVFLLHDRE